MNTVNFKIFVQSYYRGNNEMTSVKLNQDETSPANEVEEVSMTLWAGETAVETKTAMLHTDGNVSASFTHSGDYVISIKPKNALEVFTPSALNLGEDDVNYDFTIDASQAFGSNQVEVESGVFALYSGDINQDGVIDQDDLSILNNAIENGLFGIQIADLNGDGAVDNSDTDNFYNNLGKSVMRP